MSINRKVSLIGSTVIGFLTLGLFTPSVAQFGDRPTFFRDGQELIEQETLRLQQSTPDTVEHPSQLLTIEQGELRWQKYLFREPGFSIWMPQGTQSEETLVLDTAVGEISFEVFASHPQDFRFLAAYSVPLAQEILNQGEVINSVADAILAKNKLELISDRPITFEQYEGKEFIVSSENETITFRVYLIKERLYVTAASQKNTTSVSAEVTSFLNSFRLL